MPHLVRSTPALPIGSVTSSRAPCSNGRCPVGSNLTGSSHRAPHKQRTVELEMIGANDVPDTACTESSGAIMASASAW